MTKRFDNEKGIGAVEILAVLIIYIFLISLVLSFFIVNIYGSSSVPGVTLPNQKDVNIFSSDQNFIGCSVNKSTFLKQSQGEWRWDCGVGMILVSSHANAYLLVNNIQKDAGGLYQNSYWINNSATNILGTHGDYTIILRYTGGGDQNEIEVKNDGFHIPQYFLTTTVWTGDRAFFPYPNANQETAVNIKTIYNDAAHSVDFYFQSEKVFTTDNLNEDKNVFNVFGRYYGGFILEDFKTEGSIISGLTSNIGDTINMVSAMFAVIINISTWQLPSWILPIEFVQIFITLPEGLIVLLAAVIIIRGVG
jgi:hypothetical protein